MRRSASLPLLALLVAVPSLVRAQSAAAVAAPPLIDAIVAAPEVGQQAPEFTAAWTDGAGPRATPVRLGDLRGQVVVIAFYPKDRTSGCTAEMIKFRDDNARLFGKGVVVLPVSADSIASHVSWGSEMKFPFALVSDPSLTVASAYGSKMAGRPYANRSVFVIGKDGRVVYRELKFNALNEAAYTQLASAINAAR